MNVQEVLTIADEAAPELMAKTAQALAILERLDPVYASEVVGDFVEISNVTIEKTSAAVGGGGGGGIGRDIGKAIAVAGVTGLGMAVASDLYQAARRGLTKGTNFKRIMDNNPDLHKLDAKEVRKSFDMLHHYAPDFTTDPTLGGQILHAITMVPENRLVMVKDLVKSQAELRKSNTLGKH